MHLSHLPTIPIKRTPYFYAPVDDKITRVNYTPYPSVKIVLSDGYNENEINRACRHICLLIGKENVINDGHTFVFPRHYASHLPTIQRLYQIETTDTSYGDQFTTLAHACDINPAHIMIGRQIASHGEQSQDLVDEYLENPSDTIQRWQHKLSSADQQTRATNAGT